MQVSRNLTKPKIELHLGDPGMTLLHRAGLAGLWMTLKQLESEQKRPRELRWELKSRSISLDWEGNDIDALDWLLKQSFRIDDNGLIALTGLNPTTMDIQTQLTIHQGIRGTFLQHPSTYKSAGNQSKSFQIEADSPEIVVKYQALASYCYQNFASSLCNEQGNFLQEPISVAGWLNPGAVVRHVAFSSQTGFEEEPKQAFTLLFAPVACQYFVLRSRLRDKRSQYALVIPEVTDLEIYAKRRQQFRNFGYRDFHASSLGDAGLSFLTYETTLEVIRKSKIERCQVLMLGTVAWSSQQKTRTDIHFIEADNKVIENYNLSRSFFADRIIQGKESGFVVPSFAREFIAENLARGFYWYAGISQKVNSSELFKQLTYEREGLSEMVQNAQWNEQSEKLFVKACHEALRNTYGKIYQRAKDKGEVANFDRENERIRTGIGRCKNAETFREFITDFWSRAGQIPTLQEHWQDLLYLTTGSKNWKIAKDLALLALASYKSVQKQTDSGSLNDELID
jgi:CRISPR-associated protein Cas8a1/Csx13